MTATRPLFATALRSKAEMLAWMGESDPVLEGYNHYVVLLPSL